MSIQTTYGDMAVGEEGLRVGTQAYSAEACAAENTALRFGCAVVRGGSDNQVLLPDSADVLGFGATTGAFAGVVSRENEYASNQTALASPIGAGETAYVAENGLANVVKTGALWVKAESAVTKDAAVYFRHVAGAGGAILGSLRDDADTASATLIADAKWGSSAGAGELALLLLNQG